MAPCLQKLRHQKKKNQQSRCWPKPAPSVQRRGAQLQSRYFELQKSKATSLTWCPPTAADTGCGSCGYTRWSESHWQTHPFSPGTLCTLGARSDPLQEGWLPAQEKGTQAYCWTSSKQVVQLKTALWTQKPKWTAMNPSKIIGSLKILPEVAVTTLCGHFDT